MSLYIQQGFVRPATSTAMLLTWKLIVLMVEEGLYLYVDSLDARCAATRAHIENPH